ncbi:glycosyltransferase family 2 protein [Pseudomonas fluorescens]|uniref:glycosyltransferase family 2 protein n=1 Tax=Pseudomonas fluorescens TaxID=294 RepID=UPI002ACA9869|nr:glycosyltransferase family 2 protein [Pseudomonas fluorescens]MDZ5434233.1 glycosyltransferase family 2 protein [Pseudomonas fluorescens]
MTPPYKVSIVVPVYGSEAVLPTLVESIRDVMDSQGWNYEVIFICDQSPDNSWNVIRKITDSNPNVKGILLRMNAGQHNAIMAGLAQAVGDVIVTMDDDLQHSPSDIPSLVLKIQEGYDLAYARFKNRKHPLWKVLGSKLNNLAAGYLIKKPTDLYLSPFRAFKPEIRDQIVLYRGPYVYVDGLLLSVTRNISSVNVDHHDRQGGVSSYGMYKSISLWLKMATSFSIMPLRLTSLLGLVFSSLGFLLAVIFIIQKFTINSMPTGWSSLIVTILIIGGVQLLALGMLGEYLGRVLLTINARPQYVISEKIGFSSQEKNSIQRESC